MKVPDPAEGVSGLTWPKGLKSSVSHWRGGRNLGAKGAPRKVTHAKYKFYCIIIAISLVASVGWRFDAQRGIAYRAPWSGHLTSGSLYL